MIWLLLVAAVFAQQDQYAEDEQERRNAELEEASSDEALRTQFNHYDLNGDKKLDVSEVKTAFKDTIDESALFHLFTRIDLDESGTISEEEYLKSQRRPEQAAKHN